MVSRTAPAFQLAIERPNLVKAIFSRQKEKQGGSLARTGQKLFAATLPGLIRGTGTLGIRDDGAVHFGGGGIGIPDFPGSTGTLNIGAPPGSTAAAPGTLESWAIVGVGVTPGLKPIVRGQPFVAGLAGLMRACPFFWRALNLFNFSSRRLS